MLGPRTLTRQAPQPEPDNPKNSHRRRRPYPPRSHFSRHERAARTDPLRLAQVQCQTKLAGGKPVDEPAFSLLVSGRACLTLISCSRISNLPP
jgi:hypothetical protein